MTHSPARMITTTTPADHLVLDQVLERLRQACAAAGGQKAWAEANLLSPSYVSDVLKRRRDPAVGILTALGLEEFRYYVPLRAQQRREG